MGPIFSITSVHTGIPKLCSFTALGKILFISGTTQIFAFVLWGPGVMLYHSSEEEKNTLNFP